MGKNQDIDQQLEKLRAQNPAFFDKLVKTIDDMTVETAAEAAQMMRAAMTKLDADDSSTNE